MDAFKKTGCFFGSFLTVIGGISSLAMALVAKEYVIAIGTAILIGAAVPTVKNWIKFLLS